MKMTLIAALALAVMGAAVAVADTHEDRETLMKANGGALKALSGAATATPYDPALVKTETQVLIDNAAKIPGLFAPGSETVDAGASPAVWNDPVGFKAASAKLGTDAQAAQSAPDQASFAIALKAVQGDCGACHGTYRVQRKPAAPAPAQ